MLSQEVEERLAETLVNRIEDVNEYILKEIGKTINEISTLKPTDAYRLGQIIKYGGSYEKIVKELEKVTNQNKKDIEKIFDEVATNNKQFAKDFYKYRGLDYIPYSKDEALQRQVKAIADMTTNTYMNLSNTKGVGYLTKGLDGRLRFLDLKQSYDEIIDTAIISMAQGKSTFDQEMRDILKTVGHSGFITYESGRKRRLDSAVRMNILDGIRQLNIRTTQAIGNEIGADGVEISVHENPAPDHEDIQGRQFSNEQYELLETGKEAVDYKGVKYDGSDKRQIGTLNCYHKIFNIILGVNEPEYNDKELKDIRDRNQKGFDFEGKHYTMYEGTQLQRQLELKIRREKDTQVLARASGDSFRDIAEQSQTKINKLTARYDNLCKQSGLLPYKERMAVSGYRKIKVEKEKQSKVTIEQQEVDYEEELAYLVKELEYNNVDVSNDIYFMKDEKLRNDNLRQLYNLTEKYPHDIVKNTPLKYEMKVQAKDSYAYSHYNHYIQLNPKHYTDEKNVIDCETRCMNSKWHYNVDDSKKSIYTTTHEYGHIVEYEYLREKREDARRIGRRFNFKETDKDLRDTLISRAMEISGEKISVTNFKNKYFSGYAASKRNYEWFAELFAQLELGEQTPFTQALLEWLEVRYR